jgi:internalin A
LGNNQISDISPLAELTNMKVLCLSDNQITDIAILAEFKDLEGVLLRNNPITDRSPVDHVERVDTFMFSS